MDNHESNSRIDYLAQAQKETDPLCKATLLLEACSSLKDSDENLLPPVEFFTGPAWVAAEIPALTNKDWVAAIRLCQEDFYREVAKNGTVLPTRSFDYKTGMLRVLAHLLLNGGYNLFTQDEQKRYDVHLWNPLEEGSLLEFLIRLCLLTKRPLPVQDWIGRLSYRTATEILEEQDKTLAGKKTDEWTEAFVKQRENLISNALVELARLKLSTELTAKRGAQANPNK